MSLFQFPFIRKSYPTLGNPAFVDDVVAANELTLDGFAAITGLSNPGFCILTGLVPNGGQYGPGVFYLNGFIYYMPDIFNEGLYLTPVLVDTLPKPFSDTNSRPIYTLLQATATSDSTGGGAGATPIFNGSMGTYRFDLNSIKQALIAIQNTINVLGTAAFADIGTTLGTVAAGDDIRFGYSVAAADAKFATKLSVLLRGNTGGNNTGFIPTDNFDPATKKYVDDNSAKILARSAAPTHVGDIPGGGIQITVPLGLTLSGTSYMPFVTFYSNGTPHDDTSFSFTVLNRTTNGFDIRLQEWFGATQNVSFDWFILSY